MKSILSAAFALLISLTVSAQKQTTTLQRLKQSASLALSPVQEHCVNDQKLVGRYIQLHVNQEQQGPRHGIYQKSDQSRDELGRQSGVHDFGQASCLDHAGLLQGVGQDGCSFWVRSPSGGCDGQQRVAGLR